MVISVEVMVVALEPHVRRVQVEEGVRPIVAGEGWTSLLGLFGSVGPHELSVMFVIVTHRISNPL